MGFKIKPNLDRFVPHPLETGWGIMDATTGEIRRMEGHRHRIERYSSKGWAAKRCKDLNKEDLEK
jgi:hypothetical protein